jgi:hypothetical protein
MAPGASDVLGHRIIDIRRSGSIEEWLTVHDNGRIEHHIENNGPRFLGHGREAGDEWVDRDHVARYWPQVLADLDAAIAALRPEQD